VSSQRCILEVRVENRYFEGSEITVPVATILIDGKDLFSSAAPNGFVGFDPDELLGPDQPLLPVEQARRVAVYRCSCGEPGCGVVSPLILGTEAEVRWTDFQDFTGWFDRPLPDDQPEDGRPLSISELTFDTGQYTDEIRRAANDKSWETPTRKTARFLKEMLEDKSRDLADLGLELDWVFPAHRREASVSVSMRDIDHRYVERPMSRVVVTLSAGPGTSHDRANEMLAELLSKAPEQWMTAFPWEAVQHD
jgi:hypothetical protein